jgi:hypothetical protein
LEPIPEAETSGTGSPKKLATEKNYLASMLATASRIIAWKII